MLNECKCQFQTEILNASERSENHLRFMWCYKWPENMSLNNRLKYSMHYLLTHIHFHTTHLRIRFHYLLCMFNGQSCDGAFLVQSDNMHTHVKQYNSNSMVDVIHIRYTKIDERKNSFFASFLSRYYSFVYAGV